jgi:lysozyme
MSMWLCLAAVLAGAGLGGVIAYPYVETAKLWYNVIGVDVSNHQGDVDWPLLAKSNVAFAYMKATEGGDFRDSRFEQNWDGARKVGLPRGAYHFFTQCRSGAEQAANYIAVVPRDPLALPPVIDLEHMGPCHQGNQVISVIDEVTILLSALEAHYGRRPLLYTTQEFDAAYLQGRLAGETFWVRNMVLPPGFRSDRWLFWQYHNGGTRPGIKGSVDLNAFRGTRRDFEIFARGG